MSEMKECDCPSIVVRCAHITDEILLWIDRSDFPTRPFAVGTVKRTMQDDNHNPYFYTQMRDPFRTDWDYVSDRAGADALFEEREAQLLADC